MSIPSCFSHVGRHLLVSTLPLAVLYLTPYRRFLSPGLLAAVVLPAVLLSITSFFFRSVGGYYKKRGSPTLTLHAHGGSSGADVLDDPLAIGSQLTEDVDDVAAQMAPSTSDVETVSDDDNNFIELTFPGGHCRMVGGDRHQAGDDRDISCPNLARTADSHPEVLFQKHAPPELSPEISDEANWIEIDATMGSIVCHG